MIRIIAAYKRHESWIAEGLHTYCKRLRQPWDVEWIPMAPSSLPADRARQEESERILTRITPRDFVILLDETGELLTSPKLSQLIQQRLDHSQPVCCVVGGAHGVNDTLKQRADFIWSLSPLIFPHQLAHLILSEQLYRAQEIAAGRAYHHE